MDASGPQAHCSDSLSPPFWAGKEAAAPSLCGGKVAVFACLVISLHGILSSRPSKETRIFNVGSRFFLLGDLVLFWGP